MARTLTDEDIKLNIIINGNPAQKQLVDLEKATRKLTEENKQLGFEKGKLEKAGQKESAEYKNLTAKIKENQTAIDNNKASMKELTNQIGVTGLTMKQLGDKAVLLRMQLNNAVPGGDAYQAYQKELKEVDARLSELKGKAQSSKLSISSLADGFNKYAALGASVIAGLTGVVLSVQKIIDLNGKLSDSQADVMKTTGMNKKEVDDLTKSFGMLETRTSRIDLLNIAEQGGRIGIAKDEIGAFVDVMNKASVSLGDSFTGGAEEVANKLGKLKFLFQETKDMSVDQAYNSIGSAINDLGANGVASEANIADFATRLGSLTDVLKPTIKETLALGAAFEESGIESEVSARAYNIFMKQASTESAKFAKVMNISQKSVEDMINTDPLDFMLKFAEGMKGMDATKTAKTLDYLGVNADGANKVIGAMGNNIGRFKELIDLSNNSFAAGTSLIAEYNIKNETLGATLEKISKKVSGWFSSETFIKYLGGVVLWFGKLIGATEDADGTVSKWKDNLVSLIKIISIVLVSFFSYSGALQLIALWTGRSATATALSNLVFKVQYYWLVITEVATKALALTQSLLTFKIAEVRKAYLALMASMSLNPWGALIAIIAAAGAAYVAFSNSNQDSQKIMEANLQVMNSVSEQTENQKTTISDLVAIMKDENATIDQKRKALETIKKISDGYLEGLNLENIATAEGTRLIKRYIDSIDDLAKAKAMVAIKTELNTDKIKSDNRVLALSLEKKQNKNEGISGGGDDGKIFGIGDRNKKEIQSEIDAEKQNRNLIQLQIKALDQTKQSEIQQLQNSIVNQTAKLKTLKKDSKAFKELTQDIKNDSDTLNILTGLTSITKVDSTKSDFTTPGGKEGKKATKNPNSSQAEIDKLFLDDDAKYKALLLAAQRKFEDDKIATMADGYEKEMLLENQRHQRIIDDLESQRVHNDEFIKLNEEISKAQQSGDKTKVAALETIKTKWGERNKILDAKICEIEEKEYILHNQRMGDIEAKAGKTLLQLHQEQYDDAKAIRETAFLNEMADANLTEEQKKVRQDQFNEQELKFQKQYLEEKLAELQTMLEGKTFGGIDFSLLSPEQKEDLQKNILLIENAIAKLRAAKEGKKEGQEIDLGLAEKGDILGFTQATWDNFFKNIEAGTIGFQTMQMAIMAASQVFGQIDSYMTASENHNVKQSEKNSEKKKQNLKRQLDAGYINQNQYNKRIESIDKELDNQKLQIEIRQAKRQKALAMMNIITNTAAAIMGIWKDVPKFDFGSTAFALSVMVGTLGAIQLATVAKQPMPGHEEGLYPEYVQRQQDGKRFKAGYQGKVKSGMVNKTSYFMVAENGPEMVIDNKAWRQISPETQNLLIRELQGIKGFEKGYYKDNVLNSGSTPTAPNQPSTNPNDDTKQILQMVLAVVAENTKAMNDLRDKGVVGKFYKNDLQSMKQVNDGIKDYNALRNRNKI